MRTRSIVWLVLLATAPLVLAQMSQVTLVLYSGQQHLIRYDYDGSSAARSLANVIGSQVPPGSTFVEFDPVAQAYRSAITRDTEGAWGPRGTTVLQRGTAYWLGIPPVDGIWVLTNSYTVTLTGDVPVSNLTMVCRPLWNAVGYPYPVDRHFTNTQYAKSVTNGSLMLLWDVSSQSFLPAAFKTKAGWTAPASTSVLSAGQGYFLWNGGAVATNIVELKPY